MVRGNVTRPLESGFPPLANEFDISSATDDASILIQINYSGIPSRNHQSHKMFASRNLVAKYCLRLGQQHAQFHATARAFVQVGDTIPDLEVLAEGSPGNKVNLGQALKTGKGLVIGVPAAFSLCNGRILLQILESADRLR